jgi:hypothetical protein
MKLIMMILLMQASLVFAGPTYQGRLFQYQESDNTWINLNSDCSVEVLKTAIRTKHWEELFYTVKLKGMPNMNSFDRPEVAVMTSSLADSRGLVFMGSTGRSINLRFAVARPTSQEEVRSGVVSPESFTISKSTATSGYFGGRRFRWSYKCEF